MTIKYKYYSFSIRPQSIYQILVFASNPLNSEDEQDKRFIQGMHGFFHNSRNNKNSLHKFLQYHLEHTSAQHHDFLEHTLSVLAKADNSVFLIAPTCIGYAKEWLGERLNELNIKSTATKPSQKHDISFERLFHNFEQWKKIEKHFQSQSIIGNNTWNGTKPRGSKIELAALAAALLERRLLTISNKSEIGRILTTKFNTKMQLAAFTHPVKDQQMHKMRTLLDNALSDSN